MAAEIDRLVTRPEQRALRLHPAVPGAHEEQRIPRAPGRGNGAGIDLGPAHRPGIVFEHGVGTAGQLDIDRQVLAKVRHPA
ncbi:hypothetical protein D3C79_920680 [compost metagenome]